MTRTNRPIAVLSHLNYYIFNKVEIKFHGNPLKNDSKFMMLPVWHGH